MGKIAKVLMLGILSLCAAGICLPQADHDDSRSARPASRIPPELRVDINHATLEELLKVPGMTRSWASRILRFRPYRTKQDLLDDGVVSSEMYERIRDYLIAHKEKQ